MAGLAIPNPLKKRLCFCVFLLVVNFQGYVICYEICAATDNGKIVAGIKHLLGVAGQLTPKVKNKTGDYEQIEFKLYVHRIF